MTPLQAADGSLMTSSLAIKKGSLGYPFLLGIPLRTWFFQGAAVWPPDRGA